jgi:hypothetical protein
MNWRGCLAASLLLSGFIASGLAGTLPAPPAEMGLLRRNAEGRIEVLREPPTTAGMGSSAAAGGSPASRSTGPREPVASGRTLVVGPRQAIQSITEAARIAQDGDTIEILPGEYRRQAVVWLQKRLTVRGRGQRPLLVADGDSAEGKALWVVRNADMLIENIEFRGTRVPAGNGAGIRLERGRLRVVGCGFFDNEMGILTGNIADTVLEVEDSQFGEAPTHAGGLHHLLYAGAIARLSVSGSRFGQGFLGHLIKSRARESWIRYNLIVDGAGGRASYELEFPNGGLAWVIGNIIGQSATTDNRDLVSYGAEGQRWPENALYLVHNTLVDDRLDGRFLRFWADRLPPASEVWAINNLLVGPRAFTPQAAGRHEGNQKVDRALLLAPDGPLYALPQNSLLRGQARHPGVVGEQSLAPTAEFRPPLGKRPLPAGKALTAGALQ